MKKYRGALISLVGLIVLSQAYQNCAGPLGGEQFAAMDLASTGGLPMGDNSNLDINHPPAEKALPPTHELQLVSREYVVQILKENFVSTEFPRADISTLIYTWAGHKAAQFGSACSMYDSASYRDCSGDSGSTLPLRTSANVLRESYRMQICENILAYTEAVKTALMRVGLSDTVAPKVEDLSKIYSLFYRTGEIDELTLRSMYALDAELVTAKESILNRWRMQLMLVCESPGWQLF